MSHSIELNGLKRGILNDDVVHAHFKDDVLVTGKEMHEMFHAIGNERSGHNWLLAVTLGEHCTLTKEARALASGPEGDPFLAADAIVVRDFGHELAANAFVRHNKPMRPTKLFADMENALAWLLEQHILLEPQ
ncbi:MAG: hypothetical protein IPN44_13720 [Flavobacteriales bacterium]|nr:hypothetical protein [Flavobacteriales bacterium]